MVPTMLLIALVHQLPLDKVIVCNDGRQAMTDAGAKTLHDMAADLSAHGIEVSFGSLVTILDWIRGGQLSEKVLIQCSTATASGPDSDRVLAMLSDARYFTSLLHWLIPDGSDLSSLPLRLDSNLIAYADSRRDATTTTLSLEEVYKVKGRHLLRSALGSWSLTGGLEMALDYKWHRRNDLSGVTLTNEFIRWPGVSSGIFDSDKGVWTEELGGTMYGVLWRLGEVLNFTIEIHQKKEVDWNGMVTDVETGVVDVVASGLTITAGREQTMDFTLGVIHDPVTLLGQNPSLYYATRLDVTAYVNVFYPHVWVLVLTLLPLLGLALATIAATAWRLPDSNGSDDDKNGAEKGGRCHLAAEGFREGIALAYLSVLQLGKDSTPPLLSRGLVSATIAYVSVSWAGYVLFATYTADLTATMTTDPTPADLKTYKDIYENDYRFLVAKENIFFTLLGDPPEGSFKQKVLDTRIDSDQATIDSIMPTPEAKYLVFMGTRTGGLQFSFFTDFPNFEDNISTWLGLALGEDSEFTEAFNYHILGMIQSGLVQRIFRRYMDDFPSLVGSDHSHRIFAEEVRPLGYGNLIFPLFVGAAGCVVAFTIGLGERTARRR